MSDAIFKTIFVFSHLETFWFVLLRMEECTFEAGGSFSDVSVTTSAPSKATPTDSASVTSSSTTTSDDSTVVKDRKALFLCSYCSYTSAFKSNLERHLSSVHKSGDKVHCTHCGQLFDSADQRDGHVLLKHRTTLVCEYCGETYTSRKGITSHRALVHGQGELKYKCQTCGKQFRDKFHLHGHINTHKNVKPFSCSKCHREFGYQSSLTQHVKICKEVTPKPICDQCGKEFSTKSGLADHKLGKHSIGKPYICSCGAVFLWRAKFVKHKKSCESAN